MLFAIPKRVFEVKIVMPLQEILTQSDLMRFYLGDMFRLFSV